MHGVAVDTGRFCVGDRVGAEISGTATGRSVGRAVGRRIAVGCLVSSQCQEPSSEVEPSAAVGEVVMKENSFAVSDDDGGKIRPVKYRAAKAPPPTRMRMRQRMSR